MLYKCTRGILPRGFWKLLCPKFRTPCSASTRCFIVLCKNNYACYQTGLNVNCRTLCENLNKSYSSSSNGTLQPVIFDQICKETLESLVDYLEELVESTPALRNADISYSDGVLTAFLGDEFGTYVINRQTPNQQIWLSSPTSGPKRYDFVNGAWIYKHDSTTLHSLLDREIGALINQPINLSSRCSYGRKE